MPAKYTLKVLTEYAAAHSLRDYPGDCRRLHGHNWKVEVEVEATALNEIGIAIDFKAIKQAANEIGDRLDHQYLNDIKPFDQLNPTAENQAAYFYTELSQMLNNDTLRVSAVTLWETDRASVRYTED